MSSERLLLSGNEAVACAACDAGVHLGTGYPGTPSTEILEAFPRFNGDAQWAPNEKVALEVGIGAAFGGGRILVTMKHVGVNVAADPLFAVSHTGVDGGLVIVSADDPGMASSQNEQDNRRYASFAGIPLLEPSDSQEAYDLTIRGFEISEQWNSPVMLRLTTRICHSKGVVQTRTPSQPSRERGYDPDSRGRVMMPANARPAHKRMRKRNDKIREWNENCDLNSIERGSDDLGIITSGVSYTHAREAAPDANILKLSFTYPLPVETMGEFAASVDRCVVVEENDPYLAEACRIHDIEVDDKPESFRFGELNVQRVRDILNNRGETVEKRPPGRPPRLCNGCPHRSSFEVLRDLDCIVTGDIGCYTLGALQPFDAMDTCLCMGASIGAGLGLRHSLPEKEARRVVSVIGDSTFVHSGLTGIAEMVYNPPPTGHVVVILDNGTTAMTGLQEHPATGRDLEGAPTDQLNIENVCKAMGVDSVETLDPRKEQHRLEVLLEQSLKTNDCTVIICRRPCVLALKKHKQLNRKDTSS
ncbi:MAG: thiamine pyrophosphate-dependent enzyme [Planctomycetota bacterium]